VLRGLLVTAVIVLVGLLSLFLAFVFLISFGPVTSDTVVFPSPDGKAALLEEWVFEYGALPEQRILYDLVGDDPKRKVSIGESDGEETMPGWTDARTVRMCAEFLDPDLPVGAMREFAVETGPGETTTFRLVHACASSKGAKP
jgi:hypothetical protein